VFPFILHPSSFILPPIAFIQVDLDGLWAVRRCYGGRGTPDEDDPVYSRALPALLDLFDEVAVKATFFVVGADAQVAWKCRHLAAAVERGHELANHSMTHDLGLSGLEPAQRAGISPAIFALEKEIADCQEALKKAFGIEARGFRAPGFGFSLSFLKTLDRLGFWYDSSLLPSPWGWVMRWITRRISASPLRDKSQYGSAGGWRAPLRPRPTTPDGRLWEIPVSVTRRLRLPFHGGVGFLLGKRWVERAVHSLGRGIGFLNYLIHGMDVVDGREWDVVPNGKGQKFFAGGTRERLVFFTEICKTIRKVFEIRRTDQWVEQARTSVKNR
jgi:peptidoglycan/xylan/chitin deacetylase (PgdA/CDA1 family)